MEASQLLSNVCNEIKDQRVMKGALVMDLVEKRHIVSCSEKRNLSDSSRAVLVTSNQRSIQLSTRIPFDLDSSTEKEPEQCEPIRGS